VTLLVIVPGWGAACCAPTLKRSFLEFDCVGAVIDAHGTELAEEILAEQGVKVDVQHLLQLIQVHDGDLLRDPGIRGY
jgi:hypothetical protein